MGLTFNFKKKKIGIFVGIIYHQKDVIEIHVDGDMVIQKLIKDKLQKEEENI